MVGIASQNENSAAERRSAPNSMAPTMVAPARDTPGIIDSTWTQADAEIHRQRELRSRRDSALQAHAVDPEQHEAAENEHEADDPHVEQHRLDETMRQRADDRRRQEREQHADDERAAGPAAEKLASPASTAA